MFLQVYWVLGFGVNFNLNTHIYLLTSFPVHVLTYVRIQNPRAQGHTHSRTRVHAHTDEQALFFLDGNVRNEGTILILFLEFIYCYSIFWAKFDAYAASPAEIIDCHNTPVVADFASHSLLGIGYEDRGGTIFQAFSTFKGTYTFCFVYLNAHCALWNMKFS